MERRVKASSESTAFLLMIVIGLVLLNVLSVFYYTRWDLTERRLHSLSAGTKRLLNNLEDELTVRAYFSEDLPPPFNAHERAVRDLLEEYEAYSGGKLTVEIIHPCPSDSAEGECNDELVEQAREDGVEKVPHAALRADEAHEVLGYRGIAFHYRDQSKAIPVLQQRADVSGLEYDFTTTIRQVVERSTGEQRTIGFVVGHGEPGITPPPPRRSPMEPEPDPGISYMHKLTDIYELREVSLKADNPTPEEFRGLVVVGPTKNIPEADLYALDQYLMRGGSVAYFFNGVSVQDSRMGVNATTNETGLDSLLRTYGAQLNHDVVLDTQSDCYLVQAHMRTSVGNIPMALPRSYPAWPHLSSSEIAEDHALLFRLHGLTLLWPSTVRITRATADNENIEARVLARTTDQAWNQTDNFDLEPAQEDEEWASQREDAQNKGRFPLIVELTGQFPSHFAESGRPGGADDEEPLDPDDEHLAESRSEGRILVVGDADLFNLQYLASRNCPRHTRSTVVFIQNVLDWLAEDVDLTEIRAKRLEDPSLPELSDSKRNWIKWGNIIAWPVLFLLFGVIRWTWRKNARLKIEQEWRKAKRR